MLKHREKKQKKLTNVKSLTKIVWFQQHYVRWQRGTARIRPPQLQQSIDISY